jgi:hypothetical protein
MASSFRRWALVGAALVLGAAAYPAWRQWLTPASDAAPPREEPIAAKNQEPAPEDHSTANIVRQGFPAATADPGDPTRSDSAWEIEWDLTHPTNRPFMPPGCTFRIRSAKFMWKDKSGKPHWIVVARMLELAEIYVPYDNGHTAFLDIHDMSFNITPARKEFLGPNCVAPGEILKSSNPAWSGTVYKEVHDDGIRWMTADTTGYNRVSDRARRGEKLILWSTYYGANYRYLIEFGFGDDGVISCRLGPTGRNLLMRQPDLGDTHLHIGCWRMEPDLGDPVSKIGGPRDNDILLARRYFDETKEEFSQLAKPFGKDGQGQACEGSARWVPEEFTTIRVQSRSRKNSHGRPISFDIFPQRIGSIRQLQNEGGTFGSNMDFINNDFWVTRTESGFTSYVDVPRYASQHRPLTGQPTTIWLCTSALHFPRSEDFDSRDGKTNYTGVATTFWMGFFIKPRDLFDGSPLYQPTARRGR